MLKFSTFAFTTISVSILLVYSLVTPVSLTDSAKELTRTQFDVYITRHYFLFVLFYTPKCNQCKKIFPIWNELDKRVSAYRQSRLIIGQVNCDTNRILCTRESITDVPTIKLFANIDDATQKEYIYIGDELDVDELQAFAKDKIANILIHGPYDDGSTNDENESARDDETHVDPEKHQSDEFSVKAHKKIHLKRKFSLSSVNPIDEDAWEQEDAKTKLKAVDGLYEITDEEYDAFYSEGEHFVNFYAPWCKHCQILEPVWSQVAKSMPPSTPMKMSRVDCTLNEETCQHFGIKEYPSILWISNGKLVTRYDGPRSMEQLKQFIRIQLLAIELGVHIMRLNQDIDEDMLKKMVDDKKKKIIELNAYNFQTIIQNGHTLVHFTVPWSRHCLHLKPELRKLISEIVENKLPFQVGVVDCSLNESLCNEAEVDGYPTLYLYTNGQRSKQEYLGEKKSDSFLQYLLSFSMQKVEL